MKQILKRTGCLLLALCIVVGGLACYTGQVQAVSAVRYAWRDDMGNIILQTSDHRKTSSVHYKTVGWTITRCVLGTREPIEDQYITVRFNDALEDVGGEWTQSSYMLSESEFLSRIAAASGEWLADIQSKKTCYLKFDAVMICVDDSKSEMMGKNSGSMNSEANQDYSPNPRAKYPGVWDKFTYEDLMNNTYGWYSPESIRTHYDIYLLYNGGEEEEPEVVSDWYRNIYFFGTMGSRSPYNADNAQLIDSASMKPRYYTWNTSDEYDLSQGIPTGEDITNGAGADLWCGYERVSRYEETRYYTLSYDLIYHEESPIYETTEDGVYVRDENGDKIEIGKDDIECHVPVSFTVPRTADYYYAAALSLYELDEADVYNSVYPGDMIAYPNGRSANIKSILDGVENPEQTGATPDPDSHIKWPQAYTATIQHDCGTKAGVDAYVEELKVHLYDDVIDSWDYIKEVSSWNDLVEVNGTKYLDDEVVTHANDTRKVRGSQGSAFKTEGQLRFLETVTDNFGFYEQEKTVTIPKDVANGAYSTQMDVVYNKKAVNDRTVRAWSTADPGESIYGHLKPGFEKNEPVQVHTPVIAPVTITDGEDTTQLVNENRSQTPGDVNRDGTAADHKALYELILDNEYTFRFDPALHREIQGYGQADDNLDKNYNKYVKNKWVRFPFTVRLLDQETGEWSEFYELGADGFTEWINIYEEGDYKEDWFSNETKFYIPPWSIEGRYYEIEYKVEATNVFDENGTDHGDDQEDKANTSYDYKDHTETDTKYVATYKVPVELSGIIYDFEIEGSNYFEDYNKGLNEGTIAFCPREMEKKQGGKNRLGGNEVRYTRDGRITNNWKKRDTLPMSFATTDVWSNHGYMMSGDTFAFSVKTIANLWDEEENMDFLYIKPSFKWYDMDGTLHKDLQIYYPDDTDMNKLIRFGSNADLAEMTLVEDDHNLNEFTFAQSQLQGALFDADYYDSEEQANNCLITNDESFYNGNYHDPDLHYTLKWHNKHYENQWEFPQFFFEKTHSFCLSGIRLTSRMRTLTGKYEQIAQNITNQRNALEKYSSLTADQADRMRYSMQTWYGQYRIPQGMLICDADTFSNMGIKDTDNDGVIDYWDYLVQTGESVDKNADWWLNTDEALHGWLILNFDITTYNNGEDHLSYYGGTKDMWQVQGANKTVEIGAPDIRLLPRSESVIEVPLESGDIAVISTNETVVDRYYSGTMFIN